MTRISKGSQEVIKWNTERLIRSVLNPNEGMIYLTPLRKGCPQMSRHIGLSVCTESKGGNGSVESDPMLPPPLALTKGCPTQIFLTFFKKGSKHGI